MSLPTTMALGRFAEDLFGDCNSSLVECSIGELWLNELIRVVAGRIIQSCLCKRLRLL